METCRISILSLHDALPIYDTVSGEPGESIVTPPTNPAVGTQYEGVLSSVGDHFRIVFNEQLPTPDGITVNAVHLYMTGPLDRKSTRLNSSHRCISYAVFCL